MTAARWRIAELETELEIHRRATALLKAVVRPKHRYAGFRTREWITAFAAGLQLIEPRPGCGPPRHAFHLQMV